MSESIKPKRGRINRPSKERFARLKSVKCFHEVHTRVSTGWPIPSIVKFIQEEAGELKDLSPITVQQYLVEYRRSLGTAGMLRETLPAAYSEALNKVEKGIDELDELKKLYLMQLSRLKIDYALEKANGKLIPTMTQEMKQATSILEKIAQIKMDLGLSKRHLGTLGVETNVMTEVQVRYGSPSVEKVLSNPESRQRLLAVIKRSAQLEKFEISSSEDEESTVYAEIDGSSGYDVTTDDGEILDLEALAQGIVEDVEGIDADQD